VTTTFHCSVPICLTEYTHIELSALAEYHNNMKISQQDLWLAGRQGGRQFAQ